MFSTIRFIPAVFKHGIREADIRWAFMHPRYDGPIEDMENKYIRIGFDPHGNLLEMMYREPLKTGCFQRFPCGFSPSGLRNTHF
jgi:hypothetical protein